MRIFSAVLRGEAEKEHYCSHHCILDFFLLESVTFS